MSADPRNAASNAPMPPGVFVALVSLTDDPTPTAIGIAVNGQGMTLDAAAARALGQALVDAAGYLDGSLPMPQAMAQGRDVTQTTADELAADARRVMRARRS